MLSSEKVTPPLRDVAQALKVTVLSSAKNVPSYTHRASEKHLESATCPRSEQLY